MDLKPDQEKVKVLLIDTISLLCRSGLSFNRNIMIQGVIGITVDRSEVFLVHINQELSPSDDIETIDVSSNCTIDKSDGNQPQKPYENKLKIKLNNSKVDSNKDPSFYISSQHSDDTNLPRRPLTYQPSYDSPVINVNNANSPRNDDDNRSLMFTPRIKKEPGYSSTPYHSGQGSELSDSQLNFCSQTMNDSMLQQSPFKYDAMNFSADFNAARGSGSTRRVSRRRGGRRGGTIGTRPLRMDGTEANTSWDAMVTTSFMCKVCGQSFVHKSNLLGHQIRIHGRQKNKRGRPPSNNSHSLTASQVTTTNNYTDNNSSMPFVDFTTPGQNMFEPPPFDTGFPTSTPNSQHYPVASQPHPPMREDSDDDDDIIESVPREAVQQMSVDRPREPPHFDYPGDFHHNGLANPNYPAPPRW